MYVIIIMDKENNYKNIVVSETKTIAILLVIFYHCMLFYGGKSTSFWPLSAGITSPEVIVLTELLYNFSVPSLILCSGFLFLLSTRNHPRSRWEMFKTKVKRLIWPYFIYGALWLVPLYTFFDIPAFGRPFHTDFVSGFISMCMGVFTDHLWFLWALFWATLFFILIRNLLDGKKLIVAGALTVIAAGCIELFLSDIPYYCIAESGPFFIVFFVGILLYYFNEKIEKWDSKIYCIISLVLFAVLGLTYYLNIDNTIVSYIQNISGALLFYFIFMAFSRTSYSDKLNQSRFYNFCESRSMNIYLLNCPFMQIYFLLLYPLIGTNVFLTILCLLILSYTSVFIAVWIQNKLKIALVNKTQKTSGTV